MSQPPNLPCNCTMEYDPVKKIYVRVPSGDCRTHGAN
jgi:hypothetical protein